MFDYHSKLQTNIVIASSQFPLYSLEQKAHK